MLEQKIRKYWLISFWISIIFLILSRLDLSSLKTVIISSIAKIIAYSIPAYITYYCAYKKKGSKWLLFIMFMVSVALIQHLLKYYNLSYFSNLWIYENYIFLIIFYCTYLILLLGVSINFLYWNYRLRNINVNSSLLSKMYSKLEQENKNAN